ncbi:helix-turn-helix domain-containing protein [Enterocloster clostridioformis]|jgi:hypothetical protein|uniref:Helix-turn-helix transcriptional regulator n=1 Tax=Enterocloster clostridioformis TaxID=1531 RepID=A0A829WCH1_9FIRM|nr:helix-turn-helix transcriptional regulator [Enterocloster clostridioformis]EHG33535.1 hypothetical protein HMPREF9467_00740 [ [[Clostridium] clostridioforme 2_1_49FAA]ENZ28766.1 hypothetical protein HMPREF1087_01262 [[Clostridium] clostridioforme 90A1]ENZ72411.1 hypothetical protein HMPREF1081_00826 [[Clostridium] clostridioforme 90A4]QIX93870.1 helix-turn-helix transcriptional regulator [Enterocloster clostridioformis]GEA37654.1 hypothetical protein Ccl03g_33670 [Enterocloster clostridiofo
MNYELKRIKQLCHERGWSLYRLAREMNASPNNIYNIFITMSKFYAEDENIKTQDDILFIYNKLTPVNKAKAEAYMLGLWLTNE